MTRATMTWLAVAFAVSSANAFAGDSAVGTAGELRKLIDGLEFTEGPTSDRDGNVYFSDVRGNRIYRVDAGGERSVFLDGAKAPNGLMVDGRRLLVCQRDEGRVIAVDLDTKAITVVADKFEGRRFIGPNDLVVDKKGGVYFTDPRFPSSPAGHQEKQGVYYAAAGGAVTRLLDDLGRPNGILLSPDEKTLYVLPSAVADVMAYPVLEPGRLGPGRSVCRLQQAPKVPTRGGDGLTVAKDGTLYIAQPDLEALQVVSRKGETLGLIALPGRPTNVEFGGKDMKTLYITLHHRDEKGIAGNGSLYAIPMKKKGHRFGRK